MSAPALVTRMLAALLAVALFLGGLLAAAEIVIAQLDRPSWLVPHETWTAWMRDQTFEDATIRAILIGLVLLGLLLLLPAVMRGRPTSLPLPGKDQGVQVRASRRGVEKSLAASARRIDGVQSASAKAGRRTVTVSASTSLRADDGMQGQVTDAVNERLAQLGLADTLRPRVRISRQGTP